LGLKLYLSKINILLKRKVDLLKAMKIYCAWLLFLKMEAEPTRSVLFRSAAWLAFNCGKMRAAEQLISAALVGNPPMEIIKELRSLYRTILISFEPVH